MKLIDEWKQAWRWFSVQAMALATALQGAWMFIPDDMKSSVSPKLVHIVTVVLLVFGVAGRLVSQAPKSTADRP